MKKTIALDARLVGARSTGDTTYWTGLLHGFAGLSHEFELVLFSNTARPENIPEVPGSRWVTLPGRQSRWWSWVQFPLAARRAGAAALHTQYSLSPLAHNGLTLIHDVSFFIGPQWFQPMDRRMLQATVPGSVRRAKRVFTVSHTSADELARYIPEAKGKTVVTYNAAPPWIKRMDHESARAFVQDKLGLSGPYLLSVSTRWPRKNMELAIESTRLLQSKVKIPLVLTGKPGWGQQDTPSHVRAVGYVPDDWLAPLYSAASLYLCPSHHEGFGLPLVEAFKCGCPVMCSSGGALPEVAGSAAFVEGSWSPSAWADSMTSLLGDSSKLASMRASGLLRAAEFSWESTARTVLETYREVTA